MTSIINYQMSIFGDYISYEPTLERMNNLAKTPSELNLTLLPSTSNVITIDGITIQGINQHPNMIQRIYMIDIKQNISLGVLLDRIDVNFSQTNVEDALGLNEISARVSKLLKHAISVIGASYWRIAINLTIQIEPDVNENQGINNLYNEFAKPLSHQIDKDNIEWQIMSNCPQGIMLANGENENVNVISIIARQVNPELNIPFIITQLDVNTLITNRAYRFNDVKIKNFELSAIDIISRIINEIEEKCDND